MISRFRAIGVLLALLDMFAAHPARTQDQPKPDRHQMSETTGTKKVVEKRLRAEEKSRSVTPLDGVMKTLNAAHRFQQAQISPDGAKVAWVEILVGKDGDRTGNTAIYVKNLKANGPPLRITAGIAASVHAEGNVAWSPDSRQLAFLSDAAKKDQLQLYVVPGAGGTPRKLTQVKGFLDAPGWSPDGKTIAVLFTQDATRARGRYRPRRRKRVRLKLRSSSSAWRSSMSAPGVFIKSPQPTLTFTNTTGHPTAHSSSSPLPPAMATTIGTSPSFTPLTPPLG
jgi:Tol biopolymer transport system component